MWEVGRTKKRSYGRRIWRPRPSPALWVQIPVLSLNSFEKRALYTTSLSCFLLCRNNHANITSIWGSNECILKQLTHSHLLCKIFKRGPVQETKMERCLQLELTTVHLLKKKKKKSHLCLKIFLFKRQKCPKLFSDVLYSFETILNYLGLFSKAILIFPRSPNIFHLRILSTLKSLWTYLMD